MGDMLRLAAPTTPCTEGGWAAESSSAPATVPPDATPPPPLRFTSADMLIPFSPKLLLAASSRFRSLNDLFATISAISGLDVRHSIGSRSMCFFARGIGCRGSVVLPSSPELSVPVPPGPPSLPCLISSSMIFSSASCFCFFSCSFCWMLTRDPTLLPSRIHRVREATVEHTRDGVRILLAADSVHATVPESTADRCTATLAAASANTTTAHSTALMLVARQTSAPVAGTVGGAFLRQAATRLVPEPAHVEVAVVDDHEEQTGRETAQHRNRHHVPPFRPVWPHAHHPQAHEQAILRKHNHVKCELWMMRETVIVSTRFYT
uniref:Uncharacterized protein n=1 Tax=Anopheles farauti TaxID=69004 RepID=A0A182QFG6_9DIPT